MALCSSAWIKCLKLKPFSANDCQVKLRTSELYVGDANVQGHDTLRIALGSLSKHIAQAVLYEMRWPCDNIIVRNLSSVHVGLYELNVLLYNIKFVTS